MSPSHHWISGSFTRNRLEAGRLKAWSRQPCSMRTRATCPPTNPVAPVIKAVGMIPLLPVLPGSVTGHYIAELPGQCNEDGQTEESGTGDGPVTFEYRGFSPRQVHLFPLPSSSFIISRLTRRRRSLFSGDIARSWREAWDGTAPGAWQSETGCPPSGSVLPGSAWRQNGP